jgi:hypothetical protein
MNTDLLGLRATLRKRMAGEDEPGSAPAPAAAASAPSQAPFFKGPKPSEQDKAARTKGLIDALRRRGE